MSSADRTPGVSIVMPTLDRLALLKGAVASVMAQTLSDWELIVVDDGSTDGTRDFLDRAMLDDPRIRWCANSRAAGPGGARNTGVMSARSEIIAFLDSDDRWLPEKLEVALERFRHTPGAGILATDYWRVGGADRQRGTTYMLDHLDRWSGVPVFARVRSELGVRRAEDIERLNVFIFALIAGCAWPQTSSILVRRSKLAAAGGFLEGPKRCEELDLWLRLAERNGLVALDEPLAEYHVEGQTMMRGPHHDGHGDGRDRHTTTDEHCHHIRFLHRLARGWAIPGEMRRCWHFRLRTLHRRVGSALVGQAPLRAAYHLALGAWHHPKDVVLILADPKGYLNVPD